MDILDQLFAEPTGVNIDTLVQAEPAKKSLPDATIKNRAATTAFLSDPSKAIGNYRLMVEEAKLGSDSVYTGLTKQVQDESSQLDMKGVLNILSDAKIPFDQKQKVIGSVKQSQFLKDSSNTLFSNALTAESKGESAEQESARLTTADAIAEIYQARNDIQGLVNAHGASLDYNALKTTGEMIEQWVMPFGNSINTGKVYSAQKAKEGTPQSLWQRIKGYVLPGSSTLELAQQLENLPPEKRAEFAQQLIDTIKNHSGIIFSNDNQFAQFDKASAIFEEGGYSNFAAFLDNVSPLLDAVGIGQFVRGANKGLKGASKAEKVAEKGVGATPTIQPVVDSSNLPAVTRAKGVPVETQKPTGIYLINKDGSIDQIQRIELNYPVRTENPASPASILQQTNPDKARSLHSAIVQSVDDELAQATHGTSRNQALVNDTYPQAGTESGRVVTKVNDIDRNIREELQIDPELVDLVHNTGALYYTKAEKAAARANVVNKFNNAEGMVINDAMSSFSVEGGRVKIGAVYGQENGGWLRAEDAYRQARTALREFGIKNEDITILKKEGLDHVPVDKANIPDGDGNYLIRIDTYHDIDPTQITEFEKLDVKKNLFDRIPYLVSQSKGSVTRWLLDAASTLHPTITGAATVTSDATARFDKFMIGVANEFAEQFKKLGSARRDKINDYIREANYNEVAFDHADLIARGFTQEEIKTIRAWKQFWDSHYYLENYDVVRTLNAQGFQYFKNKNAELYAKPIPKNQNLGGLYDPATDSVLVHSKADGDALYASGGTYARLRRPVDINGSIVEHMIVRNTPDEYLRKFRDSDRVLNYRNGYFQLQYKAPRFVDQLIHGADGDYWKAIAVAGDTAEAERFAGRMASSQQIAPEEFRVRGDDRAMQRGGDAWWDVNSASGRIAQRHRGKLLEDGSGLNHLGDGSYIVNPVDSAIRAAKSIAGRTVSRPMLEAAKARFLQQYGEFVKADATGARRWPGHVDEIGAKGQFTTKQLADARTTYEYINYLENGYINAADNFTKGMLNMLGEMFAKVGLSKAERFAFQAAESSPTGAIKGATFTAYLAANPIRQWIVQTHQVVRTWSYNPQGWITGSIPKHIGGYLGVKMGVNNSAEAKAFTKFIDDSGLLDAIDKQNLVRGALLSAADQGNAITKIAKKPFALARQVGFDVGEQGNLLGHAAAVYDSYKRAGKNLADLATRDEAYSEIRAISYDMNFAGDFPYNQTTPSMVLQFMQVPHKALLQMTNRRIPIGARMRMAMADVVLWGTPGALISDMMGVDILPDNPKAREAVVWGMESLVWNEYFRLIGGDDTDIDFSSLAPYDMTGWAKFFHSMWSEGGLENVLLNSPAGGLFLKDSSQVKKSIKSMARFMNIIEDDNEKPETFLSVADEVAKISSGYNNWMKATVLLDLGKRLDQYGDVIDDKVTKYEAWAQALGFGTASTRDLYKISQQANKENKAYKEDVMKMYKDIRQMYADKLGTPSTDVEYITKVSGRLLKTFENDPEALAIVQRQFALDLQGKDQQLLRQMMTRSGIVDVGGVRDMINQSPASEDEKKMMLQRMEDIKAAREQLSKNKDK